MHKIKIPQPALNRLFARRDTLHVFDQIEPEKTAHIVIDMQNVFVGPGQPCEIATAREIVPNLNRISRKLREAGGLVAYVLNTVDANSKKTWSNWFNYMYGVKRAELMDAALTEGSHGHALWSELDVVPEDLKVKKMRFSAFVPGASDLHDILQSRGIDTLIITGTATNVCCESTARDAMMMNYKVIFVSDGTASFNDDEHNATLGIMAAQFADVMTTDEVVTFVSGRIRQAAE
jgi:ureidoacrylate peracid hydrolase